MADNLTPATRTEKLLNNPGSLTPVTRLEKFIQRSGGGGSGGMSNAVKQALLDCFDHVAWDDDDPTGQSYIDALEDALYPPAPPSELVSITAVYTQTGTVLDTDSLDSLKPDLVVTATYEDETTAVVTNYTLSGTLTEGTSTITVTYEGKTDTFDVTVTREKWTYDISDLTKVTGVFGSSNTATCGMHLDTASVNRRSFAVGEGLTSVALASNGAVTSETSEYYPVKIPKTAVKCTVSVTPSTQYVQVLLRNLENGVYSTMTATGQTGYQEGSIYKEFDPVDGDSYVFVSTKYNSAGSAYATEPTGLDIVFE